MIAAYIVAFANAILALLVAFNVGLTQTQTGAIMACVNIGVGLAGAVYHWYASRKTPPKTPSGSSSGIAASRSTIL